jgi:hypothetical protein
MATAEKTRTWVGRTVYDRSGNKVGKLDEIYRSYRDDDPTWGLVKYGPLRKSTFVPLGGASEDGGDLRIDADEDRVKDAPDIDAKELLRPDDEDALRRHYAADGAPGAADGGRSLDDGGQREGGPPAVEDESARRGRAVEVRDRQREEYGGFSWGSAFFGWLVATGLAAILTSIASAAGAALGLGEASSSQAETIGLVGAIVLLVILALSYYAGGYVAGRLARFDGARQGLGTFLIGILITLVLAAAGALLGAEYNVLQQLNLPRIPVDEGKIATGGLIALAAIVITTLLAALVGGKAGERFHRKVDRTGFRL